MSTAQATLRWSDGGLGSHPPAASVVIPYLNPGCFFQEAIESILGQTRSDWELFLVDDGSTDGSSDLARKYAKEHSPKITCLAHDPGETRGASASRNLGIARSRGHYLAFLDADDVWLPQKLERQIAILEKNPRAGMVYGPARVWHTWDKTREYLPADWKRTLGVQPDRLVCPPEMVVRYLEQTAETPGTCSVLMRRKLVLQVGGFESSFPNMYDDQALFYKFCLRFPVYIQGETLDLYRQHEKSSCHEAIRRGHYDPDKPNRAHRTFLRWFERYLDAEEISDREVHRAFRRAAWPYRHPMAYKVSCQVKTLKKRARKIGRVYGLNASF